jgi:hypothetical protein
MFPLTDLADNAPVPSAAPEEAGVYSVEEPVELSCFPGRGGRRWTRASSGQFFASTLVGPFRGVYASFDRLSPPSPFPCIIPWKHASWA